MNILKSILIWVFIVVTLFLFFIPASLIWLVCRPFDRRQVVFHRVTSLWAYMYAMVIPGWTVSIEGREKISPNKTYIIICNHQSAADIAVLFGLFRHFKWVSKPSNFKLPVVGWVMRMNRYIEVGDSPASIRQMLEKSTRALQEGNSILIFPEGTRSSDLKLGRFHDGAFHLAMENKVPLLPVLLDGTGEALPRNGYVFSGRSGIRVKVMDEVPYSFFKNMSVKELRDYFHSFYQEKLAEMRR